MADFKAKLREPLRKGENDGGAGLIEGKVHANYALKVGRPKYGSEEIGLFVSFPVWGDGPDGLEATMAEAHAGAVLALEQRVHDLFAEIEAKRAAGTKR